MGSLQPQHHTRRRDPGYDLEFPRGRPRCPRGRQGSPRYRCPALYLEDQGILVFAWEEPLQLEKLRVYVGAIGNDYQVRAYLGGRLDETGTLREPEGVLTALIEENARAVNQWVEIYFPPDTMADNLELWTLGPTVFYEVEIHVHSPDATEVEKLSWGKIKTGQGSLSVLRQIP